MEQQLHLHEGIGRLPRQSAVAGAETHHQQTLAWTPTEKWDANLTFTHYGRQKPRTVAINRTERRAGLAQDEIGSYGIWGINAGYRFNKQTHARVGVSNIGDKKLYRTGLGARTYNEHGRAFYGSLQVGF